MQTIIFHNITWFLPETIEEVKTLVSKAKQENKKIIVRGAGHSFPFSPLMAKAADCVHVMLTYLNEITEIDRDTGVVTVQAGCHLGQDPLDPAKVSTEINSLLYQLDPITTEGRRNTPPGWTVGDLGGIIHQTIGGFTATGSSGGSVKYAFEDAIIAVRVVYHDETGVREKIFYRPKEENPDDPFWGIGYTHLGLMGVIVEFTLQCVPAFNITGSEITSKLNECEVDLFGDGDGNKPGLKQFLTQTEYTRLIWWPQSVVKKAVVWKAKRIDAADWSTFVPKPYEEVPTIPWFPNLIQKVAGAIFTFINWLYNLIRKIIKKLFGKSPREQQEEKESVKTEDELLLKTVLQLFAKAGTQKFWDIGWRGIPMDNNMSDVYMPVWFTELWISLDKAKEVMESLREFYKDPLNCGTFCIEIYAGKKSEFWLNPAYGTDVIRIDVFWFAKQSADPAEYFSRYWKELSPFLFRCHWGKYLPAADSKQGAAYLRSRYPKFDSFAQLRKKMDPYNIFLNPYWKEHLGFEEE